MNDRSSPLLGMKRRATHEYLRKNRIQLIQFIFPVTLVLTGLMAGIHFANLIGYLPALRQVEAEHVAPFWKKADEYFGRRMPVFGITLLISLMVTIFLLRKEANHII